MRVVFADLLSREGIDVFFDVGANRGQTGQALREAGYTGKIISFEPLSAAYTELRLCANDDVNWVCENYALGETPGMAPIGVSANSVSSSLLPARPETIRINQRIGYVSHENVTIRRFDDVFPGHADNTSRCYLKVDVQGFEHEVLRGALGSLSRMRAIQLEASLVPVYEGEPLLQETLSFMAFLGFRPVDIIPAWRHPKTDELLQVDVLFLPDSNPDAPVEHLD